MEEVAGNILKHSLWYKSLQAPFIIVYEFETVFAEAKWSLKTGRFKTNKDESVTVKNLEYIPIGFALSIHYLEDMGCGNLYFSYIGEDCLDVFVKKLDKILSNFETFERK